MQTLTVYIAFDLTPRNVPGLFIFSHKYKTLALFLAKLGYVNENVSRELDGNTVQYRTDDIFQKSSQHSRL